MPAMHCNPRRSANLRNLGLANQQLAHRLGAGHIAVVVDDVLNVEVSKQETYDADFDHPCHLYGMDYNNRQSRR